MERYTQFFEITSHDVDANNNARPSVITRYMQETANHHMRDRRPTYYELFAEGKSYILTRFAFEIIADLHPYDKISVHTWTNPGKAATFARSYEVECNGSTAVKCYSEWAVADRNTGKLCHTDEIDSANYEKGEPNIMNVPVKFHIPKDAEMAKVGVRRVTYSQCDMNRHMNNTYYPDMVFDYIPEVEKKRATSFSLRFMAEAPDGSELSIYRGSKETPVLDNAGGEESYYFRSVVGERTNLEALVTVAKVDKANLWVPV